MAEKRSANEAGSRPENLRAQTLRQNRQSTAQDDFKRMSFALNRGNVIGADQVSKDLLCALCQAILFEPWECKECKQRFH